MQKTAFCYLFLLLVCLKLSAVYHTVGYYTGSYETGQIAIHNNLGYLAAGSNGLQILDLTNPVNSTLIGSVSTEVEMSMIVSDGNYAYVVGLTSYYTNVVQVFDVSQPQAPSYITNLGVPDWVQKIELKDNLLFICSNWEDWQEYEFDYTLMIYDVSNPLAPVYLCNFDLPAYTYDFCVSGSRVYIADFNGMRILDISNPSSPIIVGSYNTTYGISSIAVQDNIAYTGGSIIRVLNVQNPSNPVLISQLSLPWLQNLSINGDTLYGLSDYGLYSVDISDSQNPVLLGYYYSGLGPLILDGNLAYIAHWQNGLNIVDVSDPEDITLIGSYETDGSANAILVESGIAYVADASRGLKTFDVTDSSHPVLMGSLNTGRYFNDLFKVGDYIYMASGSYNSEGGLEIVNVSNPANPVSLSYLPVQSYAPEIVVSGSYAYVAAESNGMKIFNISNPTSPVLVSSYINYTSRKALALSGNIICLAGSGSLDLVDVSNPSNPYLRGSIIVGNVFSVAAAGEVAYVADYTAGLRVIDISNPDAPSLISILTPHIYNHFVYVKVQGNLLFTADWHWNEVLIYDISIPQSPVLFRSYANNLYTKDVFVMGDLLYAAHGTMGGFSIHDMTLMENDDPVLPTPLKVQMENYPNPFIQDTTIRFDLPKATHVTLDIYNLKGQKVRSLFSGNVSKGSHSFLWNKQNDIGDVVASGIYLYRLSTPDRKLTRRMLLLK